MGVGVDSSSISNRQRLKIQGFGVEVRWEEEVGVKDEENNREIKWTRGIISLVKGPYSLPLDASHSSTSSVISFSRVMNEVNYTDQHVLKLQYRRA